MCDTCQRLRDENRRLNALLGEAATVLADSNDVKGRLGEVMQENIALRRELADLYRTLKRSGQSEKEALREAKRLLRELRAAEREVGWLREVRLGEAIGGAN